MDITPLDKAVSRLTEAIEAYQQDPAQTLIRDGLVQRFEFTYEISHRLLKRFLEESSPTPEVYDSMSFADLIRTANEKGLLLSDWPRWRVFREMRSGTRHSYDETIALEVVAGIPAFLDEARHLLKQLKERQTG